MQLSLRVSFFCILLAAISGLARSEVLWEDDFSDGGAKWQITRSPQCEILEAQEGLRIGVKDLTPETKPWDVRMTCSPDLNFNKGEIIEISARVRSSSGGGKVDAYLEESVAPNEKLISGGWTTGKDYQVFTCKSVMPRDVTAREWNLALHLGLTAGEYWFDNVSISRLGVSSEAALDRMEAAHALVALPGEDSSVSLPQGGRSLLASPNPDSISLNDDGGRTKFAIVRDAGGPVSSALSASFDHFPGNPWNVAVHVNLQDAPKKGDWVYTSFYVRSPRTSDESGSARAMAFLQEPTPPHRKLATFAVSAGKDWRRIDWLSHITDEPTGPMQFMLMAGYLPQELEIAGLRVLNFGPNADPDSFPQTKVTYQGREANAAWRQEATARIDAHRKGDLSVKITSLGRPVAGANVRLRMLRHAFPFGAAVTAKRLVSNDENSQRYREIFLANFNAATLENDLKWEPFSASLSNTHEDYRIEWTETALDWLEQKKYPIHGHYVIWGLGFRDWELEKYKDRHEQFLLDWENSAINRLDRLKGRLASWDAVNHPVSGSTNWVTWFGYQPYAKAFEITQQHDPGTVAYINEAGILAGGDRRDAYEATIRTLQGMGVNIGGIGMMGHFSDTSLTPINEMKKVLDRFAALVPVIRISELDIDAGRDEELQADFLRDFLTLVFSHPAVAGVNFWGFWEGQHWKPNAGLWRKDWSMKPAALAYRKLVFEDWWTDASGTTDSAGRFSHRLMKGDYELEVDYAGKIRRKEFTLNGKSQEVVLDLDTPDELH